MKRMIGSSLVVMSLATATQAASITHTDTFPLSTTNWSDTLTIPKFDPALGTLTEVSITLSGDVEGDAKYESLDAGATSVSLNLAAEIDLQRPDGSTLVITLPLVNQTDSAEVFDGTIDFMGDSGGEFTGLSGSQDEAASFTDAADLALFTGTDDIDLPIEASGRSTGSGAGNLITQFATSAGAEATVTYTFVELIIPEPTTAGMLGGLTLLGLMRRRKS